MNLFIATATRNSFLRKEFLKLRNKIAIPENLSDQVVNLELGTPDVDRPATLEDYFHHNSQKSDALLVLIDRSCEHMFSFTHTALFTYKVDIPARVEKPERFLLHHLSRMINNFSAFNTISSRGENYLVTSLPAKNFDAQEWRDLIEKILNEVHSDTFIDESQALMGDIRNNRRKPRRKDPYGKMFFIDDDDKHFIYARDHHSHIETKAPHRKACELNGTFRFGRKVGDPRRHFDVNRGAGGNPAIKGKFIDCHGEVKDVTKTSHLNMFMNDFF